jgi:hypothetical protein
MSDAPHISSTPSQSSDEDHDAGASSSSQQPGLNHALGAQKAKVKRKTGPPPTKSFLGRKVFNMDRHNKYSAMRRTIRPACQRAQVLLAELASHIFQPG